MAWDIKTFVVNLQRRPDRLAHIKIELEKVGIWNSYIYPAFDNKILRLRDSAENTQRLGDAFIGIYLSHLAVIKAAIALGFDEILILEDVVIFPENLKEQWANLEMDLPQGWDMFYLIHGASDNPGMTSYKQFLGNNVYRAGFIGCFGAYLLSKNGMLKVHAVLNQLVENHIDATLGVYNYQDRKSVV